MQQCEATQLHTSRRKVATNRARPLELRQPVIPSVSASLYNADQEPNPLLNHTPRNDCQISWLASK